MKFKDLSKEQQEHFKKVVKYCKEYGLEEQLEEATHIDTSYIFYSLTKFIEGKVYYYSRGCREWMHNTGDSNTFQKPEDYKDLLSPPVAHNLTWDWEDLKGKAVRVGVDPSGSNGGSVVLMDEFGNIYKVQ